MAFVLNVVVNLIETKWIKNKKKNKIIRRIKRPLSIFLAMLILFAVIFFVIFLVIPGLIDTIDSIKTYIPGIATNVQNWLYDMTNQYPQINDTIKNINIDWNNLDDETMKLLQSWAGTILSSSINILAAIFSGVANLVIGLIFAVYILLQKEKLGMQFRKIMQAYMKPELMEKTLKIFKVTNSAFTKFITGQVTEACMFLRYGCIRNAICTYYCCANRIYCFNTNFWSFYRSWNRCFANCGSKSNVGAWVYSVYNYFTTNRRKHYLSKGCG